MAETSLKQAMSILFDMEKNNYLMTKAIIELEKESSKTFEYDGPSQKYPIRPTEKKIYKIQVKELIGSSILSMLVGAFAGFMIVGTVIGVIASFFVDGDASTTVTFCAAAVGAIIGVIAPPVGFFREEFAKKRKSQEEYAEYLKNMKKYDADVETWNKLYDRGFSTAKNKWNARQKSLQVLKVQLNKKLKASQENLSQFYNTVGIDVKFRNIVPVAYMNEFLNLGISTKLEGADGLYYLTMKELRMDQMQHKLDSIVSRLDTIIDRQHSLYAELTAMNRNSERLISASINQTDALLRQNALIGKQNAIAEEIEKNSAIASYNSERIAKEAEYQSYLQRYNRW